MTHRHFISAIVAAAVLLVASTLSFEAKDDLGGRDISTPDPLSAVSSALI